MKRNEVLWILIILTWSINLFGQEKKLYECAFIKEAINTKVFLKHFFVCENKEDPFIIIDTNYYFDCNVFKVCERQVKIDRVWPKGASPKTP